MSSEELKVVVKGEIIAVLAGPVATRRCGRNGREATGYHEAGHAVAARHGGLVVCEASVVERPSVRIGPRHHSVGHIRFAARPLVSQETVDKGSQEEMLPDHQLAARLGMLLAPTVGWRSILRYVRGLRVEAEQLLTKHWQEVEQLAAAFQESRTMTGAEIEEIFRAELPPLGS
jgi:hypothetical protein